MRHALLLLAAASTLTAQPIATPLWLRGYSVIPTPQSVALSDADIPFTGDWRVDPGSVAEMPIRWSGSIR